MKQFCIPSAVAAPLLLSAFLVCAASCSSSGGTETDNPATPLTGFASSSCKTREPSPGQLALIRESDADGLQCIEWEQTGSGSLTLRLFNFPEPCGDNYLGTAALQHDGTLELSVHKDSCEVFRCGLCIFDFEYQLADVPSDMPLALRIGSAVCASEPTTFSEELSLPVDTAPNGSLCRYLERSPLEQFARARGVCGERNMPCGDCQGIDLTSCTAGLSCAQVTGPDDARCLLPCQSDDDCSDGLTTCQDGLCQALATF